MKSGKAHLTQSRVAMQCLPGAAAVRAIHYQHSGGQQRQAVPQQWHNGVGLHRGGGALPQSLLCVLVRRYHRRHSRCRTTHRRSHAQYLVCLTQLLLLDTDELLSAHLCNINFETLSNR